MKKIILSILVLSSLIWAKEPYYVVGGRDLSSFDGAEDILSVQQGHEWSADKLIKIPANRRFLNSLARLTGIIFFWIPINNFELVLQHEVFGHGYRIRDIGRPVKVKGYSFDFPVPYGDGGGATSYTYDNNLTSFEEMAISAGGVEGTAVLANRMKMKCMYDLCLDGRKSFLYILSQQDLTDYAYTLTNIDDANDGNDMKSYLYWLNITYYYDYFSIKSLKKAVLINLLDPFTYYYFGALFHYIVTAKQMKAPMLKWKDIKFMPNARMALAPYGPEYYIENFISYKNAPIYGYLRFGKHAKNLYGGLGIEWPEIWNYGNTLWGLRCDIFYQPKYYSKKAFLAIDGIQCLYFYDELRKSRPGITLYAIFNKRISKKGNYGFYADFGYKTKGFVSGQSLKSALIWDIGFSTDVF